MLKSTTVQWTKWAGAGSLVLMCAAGCADRNKNGQPESAATSGEVASAVDKAGDAAGKAADSAGDAMKNLDDAATITPKVKTALGNNPALKGTNINVDTTDTTMTLSGSVKNAAQSKMAETIARKNAVGYKVANSLKVSGGASPVMKKNS